MQMYRNNCFRPTETKETELRYFLSSESFWGNLCPEAEFLDVIGTKILKSFLLAIHSHLY